VGELPVPEFDQLHVISDLHMGGEAGRQIFTTAAELAALIRHLRDESSNERVALLINGDSVDFLAEPNARYFDPHGATAKLDRIFQDPAFNPVWTELRSFVAQPNRRLIVNLGNHDLELALPWVRDHFTGLLERQNPAAVGQTTLVLDGTGFSCTVASKRVLCIHGNEVDTWNVADHEMVRRIGRDLVQGRPVEDWTPNAGTKLVIDVMNGIKRNYAFVDLLKPEVQALVPVLIALDQSQAAGLQRVVAIASRLSWDRVRRATGFLSFGEQASPTPLELEEGSEWARRQRTRTAGGEGASQLEHSEATVVVAAAEENFRSGMHPISLVDASTADQLGAFGAGWAWARGKSKEEVLYAAVRDLEKDRSFYLDAPDETFRRIDKFVGANFDYVVAGHTHMERQLPREHGSGTYFNTGSWVPRMQFTPAALASIQSFRPVFEALQNGRTVASLAAQPDLLIYAPIVLSIRKHDGGAQATLNQVSVVNGQAQLAPLS